MPKISAEARVSRPARQECAGVENGMEIRRLHLPDQDACRSEPEQDQSDCEIFPKIHAICRAICVRR